MVFDIEGNGCGKSREEDAKEDQDHIDHPVLDGREDRCPDKDRDEQDDRCLYDSPYRDEEDLPKENIFPGGGKRKERVQESQDLVEHQQRSALK